MAFGGRPHHKFGGLYVLSQLCSRVPGLSCELLYIYIHVHISILPLQELRGVAAMDMQPDKDFLVSFVD